MPFITEILWQRLTNPPNGAFLAAARWPAPDRRAPDQSALQRMTLLQELVGELRSIRAEYGVQPGQRIRARVERVGAETGALLETESAVIAQLARLSGLEQGQADPGPSANAVLSDGTAVSVPLGDLVDLVKECGRLRAESERLAGAIAAQEAKLGNEQFVGRAPAAVVERERAKLAAWREQADVLAGRRRALGCDR
jgi:valyl-tRNA synthetase